MRFDINTQGTYLFRIHRLSHTSLLFSDECNLHGNLPEVPQDYVIENDVPRVA